ncbi:MAG TPA: 3-deoxy-7-phosphoheptulonate synthase [Burkholderiales bacterium]|nr:3-deoxy-7-phosphoheptulonate synthase [Burkholderiales bacterium]
MGYRIVKKIPTADEIIAAFPLSDEGYLSIDKHRIEIEAILSGKDQRLIVVVGPCSAWPDTAVLEYAERLKKLNEKVSHALKLVMRVYIQKPRTIKGWTGPVNQPDPLSPPDIAAGALYCRKLMTQVVEMGLPIADEALFTHNARGFIELLSWVAIGARSSEDQEHRIFASGIDCPVGIKNPTHGSIKIGINGVVAAQHSHYIVLDGNEVETDGNQYAHLVLRGSNNRPNYSLADISEVAEQCKKNNVYNPAVIIDVSHDNCVVNGVKDHNAQADIILEVVNNLKTNPELKTLVKGFMLESFIKPGKQNAETANPIDLCGLSITDPCLGWDDTEALLLKLADLHIEK